MKKIILLFFALLTVSVAAVKAQVPTTETYFNGAATEVYMGGKHVSDISGLTMTVEPTADGRYCLSGKVSFTAAGFVYHSIDFSKKQVVFDLDNMGNVVNASGQGSITVRLFNTISAMSETFNVTSLTGVVYGGKLHLDIHTLIPNYRNGYEASFVFDGTE